METIAVILFLAFICILLYGVLTGTSKGGLYDQTYRGDSKASESEQEDDGFFPIRLLSDEEILDIGKRNANYRPTGEPPHIPMGFGTPPETREKILQLLKEEREKHWKGPGSSAQQSKISKQDR